MMGSTDQALAALLADMADRGLLQETLVCFVTEFGRTPRVNDRKGRIAIGMPIDASGQFRPAMHHDSPDQVKFSRAISAEEAAGPQEPAG